MNDKNPHVIETNPELNGHTPKVAGSTPHPNQPVIRRPSITSSNIKSVEYNVITEDLTVEFKLGAKYSYAGVSEKLFDSFLAAKSQGSFFSQFIKNVYKWKKL